MSSVEERRAGLIRTSSGGYRGTLATAKRNREKILKELPNIPYFTFSEQQEFIRTNGGQFDGQSFCGTIEGYPDGNCTYNSLDQFQKSKAVSSIPLLIPKKQDWQEWTTIQREALAIQGIEVTKQASTDYTSFRGTKKYKKNVVYYTYSKLDPRNYQKYLEEGSEYSKRISYSDPQQKPLTTPTITVKKKRLEVIM